MPVQLGVLADIHGDADMLQKAMALLRAHGAESFVCAGDLVNRGIQNDEVVEIIQSEQIPCVLGNHDAMTGELVDWLRHQEQFPDDEEPVPIRAETAAFVGSLPMILRLSFEGADVLLAHGTPWDNTQSVFPDAPLALLERIARGAAAQVILLGHTHIPMRIQLDSTWILNPGSIWGNSPWGADRPPSQQTCALLTLPSCDFTVYDITTGAALEVPLVQY